MALRPLHPFVCLVFLSCAPVSYLENHEPTDLIFQKKTYGGVATLVGTELQAPGFSLYADGRVFYYQYIDGKRQLVYTRLAKKDFLRIYAWIEKNMNRTIKDPPKNSEAPITEFSFGRETTGIEGLGFVKGDPGLDSLQEFSKAIDRINFDRSKRYMSNKIILYVKKLPSGDPESWPKWDIKDIDPASVYRKELSFYEPNSDENSLVLEGDLAKQVQNKIEQASIYQKFGFNNQIFAVGYRPVLP